MELRVKTLDHHEDPYISVYARRTPEKNYYGAGSLPVKLSVFKKDTRIDLIFINNGKGLATGLVDNLNAQPVFREI